MIEARRLLPPHWILISLGIGAYAALVASAPSLTSRTALAGTPLLAIVAFWTLASPHRWIAGFLASALLLPPLPIALGNSGPHPSLLFAAFGILAGALYVRSWHIAVGRLPLALVCLSCILLGSVALAAFYSGAEIALQGLARVLLFGIGVYLFFYAAYLRLGDRSSGLRPLFWAATASAAIACVDFYYQLPAPAGFGPQFIWTEAGVYRRAQGIFYEASTLGNLCVFFLVMIAVAFSRRPRPMPVSRPVLLMGGMLFSAALIFSYSRASVVNLVVALAALGWLDRSRIQWRRTLSLLGISITAGAAASYYFLPQLVQSSWQRLYLSAIYLFDYGEAIFSGRFESWRVLLRFLNEHPWHAVFGIGYKTLPYSDYIGQTVIGDNMYLSMLVETGVIGLAALLWLNIAILGAARRAARHNNPEASFFGTWMFCFWLGQCVQMLAADLLTYWRVLPVYFLVLAWAVRESSRVPVQ
ncbi:MAG: O-antigen ligase family protein [Acidobacteriia bacterium]|nr:O-antigen ligase family protein [Terriglobia bacterium]